MIWQSIFDWKVTVIANMVFEKVALDSATPPRLIFAYVYAFKKMFMSFLAVVISDGN